MLAPEPGPGVFIAAQAWRRLGWRPGYAMAKPPVLAEHARIAPGPHEYNVSWYDPRTHDANFVVLLTRPDVLDPMTRAQAVAAFGPPEHEYRYREYLIMTWDKNLLSELAPPAPS